VPTHIFHAKDDQLASYADTAAVVNRFPYCTFISFKTGGHLMTGHAAEIEKALGEYMAG